MADAGFKSLHPFENRLEPSSFAHSAIGDLFCGACQRLANVPQVGDTAILPQLL
jgi:hypothetical protein